MKRLLLLTLLFTTPLFAQSAATIWVSAQQNRGGGDLVGDDDIRAEFDDGHGFGVSVARRIRQSPLSAELSMFRTTSGAELTDDVESLSIGDVKLLSTMGMLRWHFRAGQPLDVYAGAGIAYVVTGELSSAAMRAEGINPITLDDPFVWVAGGGVTYDFTPRLGVALDARYMPVELRRTNGEPTSAGLDPLLVSAGLRIRF
jgi:outer membrane protein W